MLDLKKSITIIIFILLYPNITFAEIPTKKILDTLENSFCYNIFWNDYKYELIGEGKITIRKDRTAAYIWTEDLKINDDPTDFSYFYQIISNKKYTVIATGSGYNRKYSQNWQDYHASHDLVFDGNTETAKLHIPTDCTPNFDHQTPLEKKIFDHVVFTMVEHLNSFNKTGAHFPRKLKIIIGKFKAEDGNVLVYIPLTNEIFQAGIDSPDSFDPGQFNGPYKDSAYVIGEVYNPQQRDILKKKIAIYGVEKEITLE